MKSKRILFFKLGALGDVLMSTPLVRQVRRNFPDAKIDYLIGKSSVQSLIGNKNIDEIISFDQDVFLKRDIKGLIDLIKNVKSKKYDIIFVLDKHWIFNLTSFFFGIKKRIGFQRGNEGVLLTKRVKYKKARHEIFYYLDLGKSIGLDIDYKDVKIDIFPSKEEVKNADRIMKESDFYVIVNSGGNNSAVNENIRKMPDDLFMEIIKELSKKKKVIFVAAPNEREYYDSFIVNKNCINLSGKTNIRETYCIMKKAKMIFTTDCGPMHIGSAATNKIISVFGPTNPARKAPLNKGARSVWKDQSVYDERYELYGRLPKGKFFKTIKIEDIIQMKKD